MSTPILTAADQISYPEYPEQFFSVPNDRIGTELKPGERLRIECRADREQRLFEERMKDLICDNEPDASWKPKGAEPAPQPPKALTHDDGKPPLATLPWKALREVAMVQAYGAKQKYSKDNWRLGMEATRNASCAIRHIADYLDGHDKDAESSRHALGHAACRILFLLENIMEGTVIDDRHK